ncbi:hypothetical protein RCU76_22120, partial [Escherichia coli]|nr:hypothetical protein [Escherichia coli]
YYFFIFCSCAIVFWEPAGCTVKLILYRKYSNYSVLPADWLSDFCSGIAIKKNGARRRPVTGRSTRTGEEAQCICSYSEQIRPEALISGCVCCFLGMIYPHIQKFDPVNRSMNDQKRIH